MRSYRVINTSLFLAFLLSACLNIAQNSWAEQEKKVLGDELSGLRQQAQIVGLNDKASPTPSPSTTPEVAGQTTMKIALFDVSLTIFDPVGDMVYGEVKDGSNTVAGFTTQTLLAKYPGCKAGALGTLVRTKAPNKPSPSPQPTKSVNPTKTPSNQPFSKTVAGYIYSYKRPTFSCANDQAGLNGVAAAVAAIKNGVLPTLVQTP